jgi:hypothetical protein
VIVFEGQPGPISKWNLLLQDLLILGIQILSLCISYERQKIGLPKKAAETQTEPDVEAAEEGRARTEHPAPATAEETSEGIEMQSLLPESGRAASPVQDGTDDLLLTVNIRSSLAGSMDRSQSHEPLYEERIEAGPTLANIVSIMGRLRAMDRAAAANAAST